MGEKEGGFGAYDSLPIPTYEEAISRPSSSQSFLGPAEVSHDAEREGLLPQSGQRFNGYQPPTVESARSSLDFLPLSPEISPREESEGLRQEMEQMEILDPLAGRLHQASRGNRLSKHITSLKHSLSSIHLPFRQWLPSFRTIRARIPSVGQGLKINWIILSRIFALILVVTLIWLLFVSDLFSIGRQQGTGQIFDPESVKNFVQNHIDETRIRDFLEHLTSFDHMAGTEGNFVLARWMEDLFNAASLENVGLERFDVYLNYPTQKGRRVALVEPPSLAWTATLDENLVYHDREQTRVFHGLSKSGNVTGRLVYANYGSREDFEELAENGVDVTGSIVLVRYYGSQGDRALKVKTAAQAGAVGCIIYSDPAEDGFTKGETFPNGRYMPDDGVQRGTVALTSWVAGDVLSSGFPSLPGERKRNHKEDTPGLNQIPSLPLASRDAQKLLTALKGHGKKLKGWTGGLDLEYWSGDQSSPIVHLMNEQDEIERQPIYNVLGKIMGVEQAEKSIVVGNHRDAWCFGAADPGSGTAIFREVIRVFGELRKLGWRPLRTIEFASWDAEEYNLIGSTEHVEARIDDLRRNGFAYLNLDVGVIGKDFRADGCPGLEQGLLNALGRVNDPFKNQTLRSIWEEKNGTIGGLGAGSDYVAFQDMAGVSSIDIRFDGPEFPYHSCYDNFDWMAQFGDPGFAYHKTLAQVWALLILEMADAPILPLDHEAYARHAKTYLADLQQYINSMKQPAGGGNNGPQKKPDLKPLQEAIDLFATNAEQFHRWDKAWTDIVYGQGGFESKVMAIERVNHNTRMADFESNLLDLDDGGGLPGREQYKHVLFAPALWDGYKAAVFPGVRDAVERGDWEGAGAQVLKAAERILYASRKLVH